MNKDDCIIILRNNENEILLNKSKSYEIDELRKIFNCQDNLIYVDYDNDEIEITEQEEINYFFMNLISCEEKIKINNIEYEIFKTFSYKSIDDEWSELEKENFITDILNNPKKDNLFQKKYNVGSNSEFLKINSKSEKNNNFSFGNKLSKINYSTHNCKICKKNIKEFINFNNIIYCNICYGEHLETM